MVLFYCVVGVLLGWLGVFLVCVLWEGVVCLGLGFVLSFLCVIFVVFGGCVFGVWGGLLLFWGLCCWLGVLGGGLGWNWCFGMGGGGGCLFFWREWGGGWGLGVWLVGVVFLLGLWFLFLLGCGFVVVVVFGWLLLGCGGGGGGFCGVLLCCFLLGGVWFCVFWGVVWGGFVWLGCCGVFFVVGVFVFGGGEWVFVVWGLGGGVGGGLVGEEVGVGFGCGCCGLLVLLLGGVSFFWLVLFVVLGLVGCVLGFG